MNLIIGFILNVLMSYIQIKLTKMYLNKIIYYSIIKNQLMITFVLKT